MSVELKDASFEVKAAINDTTIAWLYAYANEIASQAARNCQMDDGGQLKGSYRADVDDNDGKAMIGTPLESGYWEEFGTGEYADTNKNGGKQGRQGWWIYTPGSKGPEDYDSNEYATKEEAEQMAAYIEEKYGVKAVVTNGRKPNYTLEKAFKAVRPKAEANLQKRLKGLK